MKDKPLANLISLVTLLKLLSKDDGLFGFPSTLDRILKNGSVMQKLEFLYIEAMLQTHRNVVDDLCQGADEQRIKGHVEEWAYGMLLGKTMMPKWFADSPKRKDLRIQATYLLLRGLEEQQKTEQDVSEVLMNCAVASYVETYMSLYAFMRRWHKETRDPDIEAVALACVARR
jgi:hypothetical protein